MLEKNQVPLEKYEQQILANYLRANNYLFYKSPSETWTPSFYQKRKNKLEGVTKGFPDITILLKRGSLLFIELKRQRRPLKYGGYGKSPSVISPEQKVWQEKLNEIPNIQCEVAYGALEAIKLIQNIEND